VQPHLSKCFDALKKLTFGEGEACNEMIALNSSEGEQVPTTEGLTRTLTLILTLTRTLPLTLTLTLTLTQTRCPQSRRYPYILTPHPDLN